MELTTDNGQDPGPVAGTLLSGLGGSGGVTTPGLTDDQVLVDRDYNPRLPNGIAVAVLMGVSLLGNSLVLYVYRYKMPRTVFSTFVTVLALLDLATTLIGMPLDVFIKSVKMDNDLALRVICKLAHLEVYSTSLASGSVLLLITITRYSKVCTPLEPGLTRRKAAGLCVGILVATTALCTVTLVINGPELVRLDVGYRDVSVNDESKSGKDDFYDHQHNNESVGIIINTNSTLEDRGKDAIGAGNGNNNNNNDASQQKYAGYQTNDNTNASRGTAVGKPEMVHYPYEFHDDNGTFINSTNGSDYTVVKKRLREVMDVYICRTSQDMKGTALHYILQAVLMTAFVGILLSLLILHCKISTTVVAFERRRSSMRRFSEQVNNMSHMINNVTRMDNQSHMTHITANMYRIFTLITVTFAVSYFPHLLCLIVERTFFKAGTATPLVTRILLDLFYNFPYINVVANPFIYGYRSVVFRQHCLDLFCRIARCCCCCRRRRRRRYYR